MNALRLYEPLLLYVCKVNRLVRNGVPLSFGQVRGEVLGLLGDADAKAEKYTSCEVDQMQVRLYGETAVVTGRTRIAGTDAKGKPITDTESLWTDTFVRRAGGWQCVATQSTPVAKPVK